jgi:hypothetical protein
MNDSPSTPGSLHASGCGDRLAWVVDLTSRRVVRAPRHLDQISSGAEAVPGGVATRADTEATVCALPPRVLWAARPAGDAGPGPTHRNQLRGRYKAVSTVEQPRESLDSAQIEVRAYAIYCTRGCVDGADFEDWLEAERQLRAEAGLGDSEPSEATPPEPEPGGAVEPGAD